MSLLKSKYLYRRMLSKSARSVVVPNSRRLASSSSHFSFDNSSSAIVAMPVLKSYHSGLLSKQEIHQRWKRVVTSAKLYFQDPNPNPSGGTNGKDDQEHGQQSKAGCFWPSTKVPYTQQYDY